MIEDLIELAHTQGVVCETSVGPDGCDEYVLACADGVTTVRLWVRPDGRFSRAHGNAGSLSLGQVMAVCGLSYAARTSAAPAA
ncbi:hypothetical protein GS894_04145 [Rhodococcus hoagii]|uniref:Uncharacterized protein n=3 Tax=Rhodococcus hoagii TaxID=43767 RepID=E9T514_RHOHA|nr:hypothetical protein [Prescottella equi]MBU4615078.1 hypothetical protein [Rhodococcus sp. GG48]MCD7049495.1 hypothetical protein [Rhodococcus sp. BH2-1]GBF14217.1 hypothetical protein Br6_01584 [Rhodococcus sp. Br-6]AVP67594.1 hypothetical protein C7H75_06285 [Prescottella equi]EGD22645.1 hypothetical protein HMPREF0724_13642 [Prescottella equi ATCC 33707]